MKLLYFKFHQNRPINEEFDCWGFKGPRGFQGTPNSKIQKTPHTERYVFQNIENNITGASCRKPQRLWARGDYELLGRFLREIDWYYELAYLSVNDQYEIFLKVIEPLIDRCIPLCGMKGFNKVPWAVNPPKSLCRQKNVAWSNYKECRSIYGRSNNLTITAWENFCNINCQVKNFTIQSQKNYEKSIAAQLSESPKLFHSYIKNRKTNRPVVGPLRLNNGGVNDDPLTMANCFVDQFASVFCRTVPGTQSENQLCTSTIFNVDINPESVRKVLEKLDPNKSVGEDGVHPRFLSVLADDLAVPLSIIFKNSFLSRELPARWLSSIIVPIYKKASRYDPLNYRPVSLTSVTCKAMERVIVEELNRYLDENILISGEQFGFKKAHSTVD